MKQQASSTQQSTRTRSRWARLVHLLDAATPHDLLALVNRIAVAAIFFQSGRTKVEGLLTLTPGAIDLFRTEYRLPLVPPELAAPAAAYAEHLFPLLLVLGLGTRFAALVLLGMTLVIQVFVYPDAWPTHLSWAGLLLYLVGRGGGRLALDRRIAGD
ncbi:MAG: DoxX family protein [Rhodoferax sp.]|jgi:putative oxidoreductase|nr:DoxX family protein [Rhodoferax sp.]